MSSIAESTVGPPVHVLLSFGIGLLFLGVSLVPAFKDLKVAIARRIYWIGWSGAALFLGLGATFRGIAAGVVLFCGCLLVAVIRAYFVTPYLKVGGRVITYFPERHHVEPSEHSDEYLGGVSAAKQWWVLAALMTFGGSAVLVIGWAWQSALVAVFLTVLAVIAGSDDGSRKLPPARGQNIQATIAALASLPLAALPLIAYLSGYYVGKRRPTGGGTHSSIH